MSVIILPSNSTNIYSNSGTSYPLWSNCTGSGNYTYHNTDTGTSNYTYNGLDLLDLRESLNQYSYQDQYRTQYLQEPISDDNCTITASSSYITGLYSTAGEVIWAGIRKKSEIIRNLRKNLKPTFSQRGRVIKSKEENEQTAIETLREMITEKDFRKYIKYGFLLVRGESGAIYQIFRDNWHTKVWKSGKMVEEICVRLKRGVPPTDNIIAFKTLIESSEEDFKKLGNVYKMAA